jgi:uncharacterized protein YmfQ (DUF2313 family)
MVSRKPDAVCFHCGSPLEKCEIQYVEFMDMTENERNTYRENYKKRIQVYRDKVETLFQEQPMIK